MKKRILAVSLVLVGVSALAFFMIRTNRIIQLQRAEVDRLHRSVANLQASLDELQKGSRVLPLARTVQSGGDATNRSINVIPYRTIMPYSQRAPETPPGWVPFEFNGMTYYRIPLASAK
jgi:hypothetical protein